MKLGNGFKDSNGKFRPTGKKKNGISSDQLESRIRYNKYSSQKNRINQLQKNISLLERERIDILTSHDFAVGSAYDDRETYKKKLSFSAKTALDRLDEINHQLPFLRTEMENLEKDDSIKYGYQDTTRSELINKLRNREVGLFGGSMTRGTNFDLKEFSNSDLKRMLESSRPLGSSIKTNSRAGDKDIFVLDDMYQKQNINIDYDLSHKADKGLT